MSQRIAYFYDTDIGSYYYGPGHPMKPQRIRMTHSLILAYDLYQEMEVYKPHRAIEPELTTFHDSDYVNFLSDISPDNYKEFGTQLKRFNVGDATDCPVFDGLYDFQRSCAGASIDCAIQLNNNHVDVAVNWSGGLHHAKRSEASGFCYMNDIVLGILELLKYHARVMYIDIDIHHGDGVEEAFYVTHRVMTVSFHKFGDFFPGTGDIGDVGASAGKYYAVNVPLNDGIDDQGFLDIFKPVTRRAIEVYQPSAIVLQCGADSVTGDRLGRFNLSIRGHAECVRFVQAFHIPLMVLGGGGYTIRNVARTWAFETGTILGRDLPEEIPLNDYFEYFAPDYNIHLPLSNIPNMNSKVHLEKLRNRIFENLSFVEHAPGVKFAYAPPDLFVNDSDDDHAEQHTVYFDGGGLAPGAPPSQNLALRSSRVRRKDYSTEIDPGQDRDQRVTGLES
eukprot:GHVP01052371.1.p1 GENE.GHVP01052371.1~~GHVP01052371.1.p1  ORF type:complete len:457 (-),score=59.45 GHVP01052371.1:964-2307(-)